MTALTEHSSTPFTTHLVRGRAGDPWWIRAALLGLVLGTAVLYLWDLGASGWANAYYSAAAQAASESWKAWFFGSSDAANAITVDKAPAALWVTGLSARLFGVNSWSILVPQALMGIGSVGLLHAAVRRVSGPAACLIAGTVLALTPVAALMFRFNNPDALLVLLLVTGAYCVTRALDKPGPGWLALAGAAAGFGFLTKMLQAFLVLPAFGLAYLIAAPVPLGKRLAYLLGALVSVIVSAGWYLAVVALWPATDQPYIGGSQNNSLWELAFGYNGLGRITGNEVGSLGGAQNDTGWARLLGQEMGSGIAWLIPAAALALLAGLWFTRRLPRTDPGRAALVLWGGWFLVTAAVFSFMNGIIHPYYMVALAPPTAALTGIGAVQLWRRRDDAVSSGILAGGVAVTALTAYLLMSREPTWLPWLRTTILVTGLATGGLVLCAGHLPALVRPGAAALALVTALAGTGGFTVATAASAHTGAIPSAGPSSARAFGPRGGGIAGIPGGRGGGIGNLLATTTPGATLVALLKEDSGAYTWAGATVGSSPAAGYQLATGAPVLAVGGFNGSDPAPTLEQFQRYVRNRQIHYFLGEGSAMRSRTGSDAAQQIAAWVAQNYPASTVDGITVYGLTG